jgi:hypothetical protein
MRQNAADALRSAWRWPEPHNPSLEAGVSTQYREHSGQSIRYFIEIRWSTMKPTVSVLTVAIFGFGVGMVGAVDSMSDIEAKPTLGEGVTKDTVKGTLRRVDGEYYWVEVTDGKEIRLHVDASTKRDKDKIIMKGDKIKAYITDNKHVTMLQRDE